jgi:hypothetical protein
MTDTGLTKQRARPELITIGNRQMSSSGRWNDSLQADYLMLNGSNKWVGIGELAKLAWHQNTKTTKEKARRYLWRLSTYLLIQKGQLISYEYSGRHVEHVNAHVADDAVAVFHKRAPASRMNQFVVGTHGGGGSCP